MQIRSNLGTNITRVNRAGVDLIATPNLKLQLGDRVTVVGTELAISHTEKVLGNRMKRLNYPNLIPIFLGIMLGCIVANIPFFIPRHQREPASWTDRWTIGSSHPDRLFRSEVQPRDLQYDIRQPHVARDRYLYLPWHVLDSVQESSSLRRWLPRRV